MDLPEKRVMSMTTGQSKYPVHGSPEGKVELICLISGSFLRRVLGKLTGFKLYTVLDPPSWFYLLMKLSVFDFLVNITFTKDVSYIRPSRSYPLRVVGDVPKTRCSRTSVSALTPKTFFLGELSRRLSFK